MLSHRSNHNNMQPLATLIAVSILIVIGWKELGTVQVPSALADSYASPAPVKPAELPLPGIDNLIRVSRRIYSGSEPHGEEGFSSLQKLGIKTVVSVDGAKPSVELARRYGLRYVHIPLGYSGIPAQASQSLARVMRDATPPVYVHCHHGKHRGPAAAVVACVAAGELGGRSRQELLTRAGTSKDYTGLWRDVAEFTPPPAIAKLPELVETADVGSLAAAMAQIDRHFDNLTLCQADNWQVLPEHPDLVAAHEALLLAEGLHEASRNLADLHDDQFRDWLLESEQLAKELRAALVEQQSCLATDRTLQLTQACSRCHKSYRDR